MAGAGIAAMANAKRRPMRLESVDDLIAHARRRPHPIVVSGNQEH